MSLYSRNTIRVTGDMAVEMYEDLYNGEIEETYNQAEHYYFNQEHSIEFQDIETAARYFAESEIEFDFGDEKNYYVNKRDETIVHEEYLYTDSLTEKEEERYTILRNRALLELKASPRPEDNSRSVYYIKQYVQIDSTEELILLTTKNEYKIYMSKDDFEIVVYNPERNKYFFPERRVDIGQRIAFIHNRKKYFNVSIQLKNKKGKVDNINLGKRMKEAYVELVLEKATSPYKSYEEFTVFENGDILNFRGLNDFMNLQGYLNVYSQQDKKALPVHRLVALSFVDNKYPEIRSHINHIDGNKLNNKASNLEWCTNAENLKHAWETGLNPLNKKNLNPNYKIPEIPEGYRDFSAK